MDWQGQHQFELFIMQYTMLGCALVAFLTGYLTSSYRLMLTIYFIGGGIILLITATDWAYFNRHPLEWLEPRYDDIPSTRQLRLKQKQQQQQIQTQQQFLLRPPLRQKVLEKMSLTWKWSLGKDVCDMQ